MSAMRVMELHAPLKLVQRSKGRSAVAAAAYRSASRLEDERTGQVHDYRQKRGVETAMLLPDDAPDFAYDRSKLWNAAEAREKRKDAQTAREIEISFPAEFTRAQRKAAGLSIGGWIVNRYKTAADLAWHEPSRKGDQRNHHVHIMFPTRPLQNGDWAEKKDRKLDDRKQGPEELKAFRAAIANILNDVSTREKLGVYVEHLSFESRGLDREATKHMGHNATEMERRGEATSIGDENRAINAHNEAREKLYETGKIVDIEEARRKKFVSAKPDYWLPFYAETTRRRQDTLALLDAKFSQQEREWRARMAALHNSIDHGWMPVRFLRKITGRTAREKEELRRINQNYDAAQAKRAEAMALFELQRIEKLEQLKREHALKQADREDQQPQTRAPQLRPALEQAVKTETPVERQGSRPEIKWQEPQQLKPSPVEDQKPEPEEPAKPEPAQNSAGVFATQGTEMDQDTGVSETQEEAPDSSRESEVEEMERRLDKRRGRGLSR